MHKYDIDVNSVSPDRKFTRRQYKTLMLLSFFSLYIERTEAFVTKVVRLLHYIDIDDIMIIPCLAVHTGLRDTFAQRWGE